MAAGTIDTTTDASDSSSPPRAAVHPVDEVLPMGKLAVLGLQHVLVMYAGAVAVPLIIGGALKLPKDQIALLINSDLLVSGIVTLIQAIGFWKFGILLSAIAAVVLNLVYNGWGGVEKAAHKSS